MGFRAIALVCLVTTTAMAKPPMRVEPVAFPDDDYVPEPRKIAAPTPPPPPPAPSPWKLEGGVGVRFGSQLVNNMSGGTVMAGHLDAGARDGRLVLLGEYQVDSLELSPAMASGANLRSAGGVGNGRGLEHRLGALARYSFGRVGESDGGADVWGEFGVGVEHYRWDQGGVWTRPDLAFGIGTSLWGQGKDKHGGFSIGLRIALARRDDVANAPVACGGPCDQPTTPTGWDRSVLFDMTMMFGK